MVGPEGWHPRCSRSISPGRDPRLREEKTLLRLIIMALLVLPASLAWAAECAPEKMVRIVTRDATPGIDPQSFAALPKTLYRIGNARGRVEEMPDAARGVHDLLVHPKDRVVYAVAHYKAGKVVRVVRYVEYQAGLASDTRLFSRPDGIQFAAPRPRASR